MTNIILADCDKKEIADFVEGLTSSLKEEFEVKSKPCNGRRSRLAEIRRYLCYMLFPIKFVIRKKQYKYVIGWQQFFALFYAAYCRFFRLKKNNILVAANFTYKEKKGKLGRLYKRVMAYCVDNVYLDYIHVPSVAYAQKFMEEFHVPEEKMIISTFGVPDIQKEWKGKKVPETEYSLAIGRSNRDYDFLLEVWEKMPQTELLLLISDTYHPQKPLPKNVKHLNHVGGDEQFPYIANCKVMIIPILDGSICSGDTVLLTAMLFQRAIMVTSPSTLGEMYIDSEINGVLCEKDVTLFAEKLKNLLADKKLQTQFGEMARKKYLQSYSRFQMGINVSKYLKC